MTRTVLLVDDDLALLDALRRGLRKEPYEIVSAVSAHDAMKAMESHEVAVVVSDDHMPGIRGSDFLAQIRLLFPSTVRIMLTGQATPEAMAQAVNEGQVFRYLTKPCPHETLAEAVRQALAQKVLFDNCREALYLLKRQTMVLKRIAKTDPGVLTRAIEGIGSVTVAEDDFDNAVDLAGRMAVHIEHGSGLFPTQGHP